ATGDWYAVFMLASGMAAVSALMAIFVLKPMREAHARRFVQDSAGTPMGYRPVPEDLT
ncbi:MAG TPA: oxalate/formate MFS antiporter, partial [Cupriavidus sp.]|nr:oxalate/formate MFS antiporter [Cupriavidus sp.]